MKLDPRRNKRIEEVSLATQNSEIKDTIRKMTNASEEASASLGDLARQITEYEKRLRTLEIPTIPPVPRVMEPPTRTPTYSDQPVYWDFSGNQLIKADIPWTYPVTPFISGTAETNGFSEDGYALSGSGKRAAVFECRGCFALVKEPARHRSVCIEE